MKPAKNTIIWDWNGTLLDDVGICLQSINSMLKERKIDELSRHKYKRVFTFPVIDYYRKVGFDFNQENWEKVAMEFMDRYFAKLPCCPLFKDAEETLSYFSNQGYRQVILSAMEHNALTTSVNARGIGKYFDKIVGIDNHYAAGKSGNGHTLINEHSMSASKTWFIGDTLHDADIARELGCQCLLIANGHQSGQRLVQAGVPVLQSLTELKLYFKI
ncbi:MAG: HAD family hydrolase [Bacteroidota bacterium]